MFRTGLAAGVELAFGAVCQTPRASLASALRLPIQFAIIRLVQRRRRVDMTKTANLYARIEPELKTEAESILSGLGVPVSNAINMF